MRMPIPQDWEGEFCRYSICWPKSLNWEIILRGLVTEPSRGFFWDEGTGSVVDVLSVIRQTVDYNLQLQEVIVSCGDAGLTQIANALTLLAQRQCCNDTVVGPNGFFGNVIIQPVSGEPVQIYGEEPGIGLGPTEFPENYPDRESYDVDKCRIATRIVDGWIATVNNLAGLGAVNFAGLVAVATLVIAGVIVFPPAGFVILFGALGAIGFVEGTLLALAMKLSDSRDDIICTLYNGESTEAILGVYGDVLDSLIAAIPATGSIAVALKTIALVLANTETLNKLFSGEPTTGNDDADCSSCVECNEFWGFDTTLEDWIGLATL